MLRLVLILPKVALRKESVDRNRYVSHMGSFAKVALRKESVDRNLVNLVDLVSIVSRSPQGERG